MTTAYETFICIESLRKFYNRKSVFSAQNIKRNNIETKDYSGDLVYIRYDGKKKLKYTHWNVRKKSSVRVYLISVSLVTITRIFINSKEQALSWRIKAKSKHF